ncbi:MAG: hypothetical protein IJ990_02690 [Alistipes sp.]|nr:hypothetical protein [Alistipes sp.]
MLFGLFGSRYATKYRVYHYGVDFSHVQVNGAYETPERFVDAFVGINKLLEWERSKYDFRRMIGNYTLELTPSIVLLERINLAELKTTSFRLPELPVEEIVRQYELPQTDGRGFVLIARKLDKQQETAFYYVVLFDVATRTILHLSEASARSHGIGLRNYWANTIYNVIKTSEIRLNR